MVPIKQLWFLLECPDNCMVDQHILIPTRQILSNLTDPLASHTDAQGTLLHCCLTRKAFCPQSLSKHAIYVFSKHVFYVVKEVAV